METVGEVERLGRTGLAHQANVTDPASAEGLVAAALGAFGKIDILVNNAGITRDDLIMRMSVDAWRDVLETNLFGAFYMTKAVMRPMLKARSGRIVNITSVSGQAGNAGQANYSSAKAGLIGLTKATAREVASRGHHRERGCARVRAHRVDRDAVREHPGGNPGGHAARPLRHRRGDRRRGRVPRVGRGLVHHGPGARGGRRPRHDVEHRAMDAGARAVDRRRVGREPGATSERQRSFGRLPLLAQGADWTR